MQSGAVVEGFDVVEDGAASLLEGGKALVVDHFVFQAAPEGFDKGVVVTIALPFRLMEVTSPCWAKTCR